MPRKPRPLAEGVPPPVTRGPARDRNAIVFEVARPDAAAKAMESFSGGGPDGALAEVLRYYADHRGHGARLTQVAPSKQAPAWGHEGLKMHLSAADPAIPATARAGIYHLRLAAPEDGKGLLDRLQQGAGVDVSYAEHPAIQYPLDSRRPRVAAAAPAAPLPAAPLLAREEEQWALDKCGFRGAWPALDDGSWDQVIAVIDQGRDMNHPELQGRVRQKDRVRRSAGANDSPHATAVAAVIAAHRVPPGGISGCCSAPIWLYDAWVSDTGFDSLAYYKALEHATASRKVKVVNLSLGSGEDDRCIRQQIAACIAAGKVVVAAAGNNGSSAQRVFPAEYDGVIAVGATNKGDLKSTASSNGSHVYISAPGTNIRSTLGSSGFALWSGTSFAAPMVTAAVAMALRKKPTLDRAGILHLLERAVVKGNGTRRPGFGFGRLDMGLLATLLATP